MDNYTTHKHPRVKRWLAARPRFHVHFTPTYGSRLNQVEIWFNRITQQAIRRGSFRRVKELVEEIDQYVRASSTHAHPFAWTATADSIFAKVQRLYVNVFPGRDTTCFRHQSQNISSVAGSVSSDDYYVQTNIWIAKRVQFGRFTPNWLGRGSAQQQTRSSPIIPTD